MYYKEQLIALRAGLKDRLADLNRELKRLPEGTLNIYQKCGKYYYCQRISKGSNHRNERRVAITKDSETVLALVRKKYVVSAIENIRKDIELLNDTIRNYSPVGETQVMQPFFEKHPELARGINFGYRDPVEWAADHTPPEFYKEDLKSVSAQGEDMRSGGEMYISSRLDHFGIPYRYEDDTGIPDLSYAPDFKIMRPRDRKIIYWEHFGKVNDYRYIHDNIEKVRHYIDYGIKPWDNFIMTFSNEKGGYNGKLIDAMIDCWLL